MAKQMGKGPKSIAKVHRQKWHEHAVFVEENLIRHIAFFASAAAEHSARKNTAYNLELVGKAERIKPGTGGKKDLITRFKENGKIVEYRVDDPAAYYAMQSAMPLVSPMLKRLRDMTGFARGVMIMNPLFWFRQAFREPVQASLVGRAGLVTPLDTLAAAAKIAAGSSKGYERLRTKGTIGPVDVIADPAEFIKISQGKKGFISKGITGIKHVHELMDAATRTVVYEKAKADALSKGFDEDTADAIGVMKAREIINFAKQGRSKFIRGVRATTPFFGAQLNSLDVMARAMAPRKAGHLSKAEAMEARRNFYSNALMLATFSTAYAAAMSEDEDYLKEPDRVGNWLVPLGDHKFLKIPIPFEAGWFTKELPELMVLFNSGALNKKEALKEGGKGLITNVVPPMPTIWFMQPFLEVAADHDFFTGSSLEGRDSEVALRDRNSKASDLSKEIVNKMEDLGINLFGVSANQLEHINKKLLGQLWAVTRTAADAFINRGKVTPKKELEEYPLISGAVTSGAKDRAVNQFYEVAKEATEIQKSFERAKSTADIERFQEILNDPDNVKYLKASKRLRELKANIGETRQGIEKIMENPGNRLDREEMTRRIKVLKERQVLIAKEGVKEARMLGLEI
jgi:primosomal protein N''